jgi:GDP/UDP-N,N'-diacetylbacillosamine 2-epimerase (hydrolysing)
MRRVCYVSGSRADFGLMARTLRLVQMHPALEVSVCVTGQHLAPGFGETVRDIEASGLRICARIPVRLDGSTGATMVRAIGHELLGMVDAFEAEKPDLVMVLGDRGEMLAGALAALHLNMPVVHLHGGERSGTVDEPVRHAISKLAHFHFVTTPGARERLVRMGEAPGHVPVTGAPGLDGLADDVRVDREQLCERLGLDPRRPVALVVFHPVVQEAEDAGRQMEAILSAVEARGLQAVCLAPNSDAGGQRIRAVLAGWLGRGAVRLVEHMDRVSFVSWMAAADVMVGNSSSGIIEAASVGLPVVNVGSRQHQRERSANIVDVEAEAGAIAAAMAHWQGMPRGPWTNVYGDGRAGERIVSLVAGLEFTPAVLSKCNRY